MSRQSTDLPENEDRPERLSNAEEAYQAILSRLRNGDVGYADRIVDTVVAGELNMSRMPAREALLRLVNEGYLIGTTRGFRLPELSQADILEIFEIRKLLEPRAAAQAAVELDTAQIEELKTAFHDAMTAYNASDPHGLFSAQAHFRNTWMEAVPNKRLVGTIARYFDQVNAVRLATLHDGESRRLSVTLVERLLRGFEKGDSLDVYEQMQGFIESARLRFVELNLEY